MEEKRERLNLTHPSRSIPLPARSSRKSEDIDRIYT